MRNKLALLFSFAVLFSTFSVISAQTPAAAKLSLASGDVVSIDAGKIVINTKDGAVDVMLSDKTEYKRVSPDNPSLKTAIAAAFSEIASGDKLIVTGFFSEDKKSMPARAVYLMTKADIAQKQSKESEQWKTRGISGRVSKVDPQTSQISIEVRGLGNTTTVVLTPKADAKFRRYAANSVKYSEATGSSVSEIQPGDMLRALGDKSADGASFAAEEIVAGAFQTVAGTVKAVDAAKNEIVITDLQTKKDVTIELGSASLLKKFPEEMAQRMAAMQSGGMRPGGAGAAAGQQRPNSGAGGGRQGMGGGQRAGGIDDMLDRFPNITAADLKAGDMIAVSSSKSTTVDRITAIKLLAGVEPFIRAAQAAPAGQGGRQRTQSLSIPGLDGGDLP